MARTREQTKREQTHRRLPLKAKRISPAIPEAKEDFSSQSSLHGFKIRVFGRLREAYAAADCAVFPVPFPRAYPAPPFP